MLWCMPLILAPTLEAEAGRPEFEAGLVCTASPGQTGLTVRPCFKETKQVGERWVYIYWTLQISTH